MKDPSKALTLTSPSFGKQYQGYSISLMLEKDTNGKLLITEVANTYSKAISETLVNMKT